MLDQFFLSQGLQNRLECSIRVKDFAQKTGLPMRKGIRDGLGEWAYTDLSRDRSIIAASRADDPDVGASLWVNPNTHPDLETVACFIRNLVGQKDCLFMTSDGEMLPSSPPLDGTQIAS